MAEVEITHFDFKRRELARCKKCKKGYQRTVRVKGSRTTTWSNTGMKSSSHSETFTETGERVGPVSCPGCNKGLVFSPVKGRVVPEIKCGSKCQGATGPSCDCACGGANHGGGCAKM